MSESKAYILWVGVCEYDSHGGVVGVFPTLADAQSGAESWVAKRLAEKADQEVRLAATQSRSPRMFPATMALRWAEYRGQWTAGNVLDTHSDFTIDEFDMGVLA